MHYYSEMSAMGDWWSSEKPGRIADVSIPLCVIHALDDPLISWRAVVGIDEPETVVSTGNGYLMVLLTKSGGHVGKNAWNNWTYLNLSFISSHLSYFCLLLNSYFKVGLLELIQSEMDGNGCMALLQVLWMPTHKLLNSNKTCCNGPVVNLMLFL
jgi:hypothetical protein